MPEILVVSGFWPTTSNPISGIFASQQVAAFCRAGCRVTVITGRTIGKPGQRYISPKDLGLPVDKVTLLAVSHLRMPESLSANWPGFALNVRSIGLSISRAIASYLRRGGAPQGCIIHGLRYYAFSAPYWSRSLRVPRLAFVHGADPFLMRPSVTSVAKSYMRDAEGFIDRIVLVGRPLRRHVADLGIDEAKAVVIPNGTDLPEQSELSSKPASPDGVVRIASISNLIALKGIDDNIRALWLLKEQHGIDRWQYSVVGDGPEKERLTALVKTLSLNDHVHFIGRLPYRDSMRVVAEADIFSLPSWGEAFGIVYLEAMARMKPTIGCFDNGAADIITNGIDGLLVPPKDPTSLAIALKRLIENPQLRKELGQHARLTAERFSWDANARRILELLGLPRKS